ncbi:haloacid dehalogenase-like hydrolase domain-containing protein 3 [Xenopus tropicalis]|uniref:Haloacid dehalogenase-like hydrolase domain-containing protein 3 n=1 Tax=Xenopus tropicalis TaxID=8364 RepID=HDHD3_XENTR|nr:haloacid dehalogenase-like hydrolase domain-containing protein 3 [Xenopus tropicalis]Q08CY5.1 RecName: Full=Haloacid dehalogenase-like hydrolase domain-containing protein 3 [Xenopus tropicalis]AAI24033.1 hypothetical protein MGC147553 [Xenopus tropicalis]|eukprot:NP_001072693.1 haloacid dehalogenase-like hydrolase domain-containing protein 3 [Xenopus tropicalis]
MSLRLITWDIKDTLLRVRVPVGQQYFAEAKRQGLCMDPGSLETSFRNAYRTHSRLFPNYGLAQGMDSRQWWLDVVLQTFRLSGAEDDETVRSVAQQLYQDFSTARNWAVVPGAREALDSCKGLGLKMAVISNFDRRLEEQPMKDEPAADHMGYKRYPAASPGAGGAAVFCRSQEARSLYGPRFLGDIVP